MQASCRQAIRFAMNNSSYPQGHQPQNQHTQPKKQTPAGGELFVGLNILSKIGVVFIILGVIAFAAVSEGYLPATVRMIMIFAVGAVRICCRKIG